MRIIALGCLWLSGWGGFNGVATEPPAPIPINANLELTPLTSDTLLVTSYTEVEGWGRVGSNGVLLVHEDAGFLIDTPMEEETTRQLLDHLESEMQIWLVGFLAQHWHRDSMGGLTVIQERSIPNYASNRTRSIARERGLPIPEIGFEDETTLPFANRHLYIRFFGPAHTSDGVVVWIPQDRLLVGGCTLKSNAARNLGNLADADPEAYPLTLQKLWDAFGESVTVVVPGHGLVGGPEIIRHNLQMARQLP